LLAEHGVEVDRRDYFKDPFTVNELRELFDSIGIKPSDVVSKRSKAYKELALAEREVSEDEWVELMVEHPTLIRRPVVVNNQDVVVGFNQGKIEALIQNDK
jgi:arsenate reductase (glutaredoxin)